VNLASGRGNQRPHPLAAVQEVTLVFDVIRPGWRRAWVLSFVMAGGGYAALKRTFWGRPHSRPLTYGRSALALSDLSFRQPAYRRTHRRPAMCEGAGPTAFGTAARDRPGSCTIGRIPDREVRRPGRTRIARVVLLQETGKSVRLKRAPGKTAWAGGDG